MEANFKQQLDQGTFQLPISKEQAIEVEKKVRREEIYKKATNPVDLDYLKMAAQGMNIRDRVWEVSDKFYQRRGASGD